MKFPKSMLITFYILFSINASFGQQPCSPTLNNEWKDFYGVGFEPWPFFVVGWVDFKFRIPEERRFEINVNWRTLNNLHKYGITNEELKQMMYKAIITQLLGDCNPGIYQFVFYEETECRITKKCYLRLKRDRHIYSVDDGWPGPNPDIFEYSGERYYKVNSQFVCGTQCCELVYNVECISNPIGGGNYAHILSIEKHPFPSSHCPESTNYDCLIEPPVINQCESTCY